MESKTPLEEAAEKMYPTENARKNMFHDNQGQYSRQEAFIKGVKSDAAKWYWAWQQAKSKDVHDINVVNIEQANNIEQGIRKNVQEVIDRLEDKVEWNTNQYGYLSAMKHVIRWLDESAQLPVQGEEKHFNEFDMKIKEFEGVLTGLKICKEMWAQGTITHENIYENEVYYKELIQNVKDAVKRGDELFNALKFE